MLSFFKFCAECMLWSVSCASWPRLHKRRLNESDVSGVACEVIHQLAQWPMLLDRTAGGAVK